MRALTTVLRTTILLATLLAAAHVMGEGAPNAAPPSRQHEAVREGSDFSDSKITKRPTSAASAD